MVLTFNRSSMLALLCLGGTLGWTPATIGASLHRRAVTRRPTPTRIAVVVSLLSDGNELAREFHSLLSDRCGMLLGKPRELLQNNKVNEPWVLIFNSGRDDEGVYTLNGREDEKTYVLAFEQHDEASRFATLLQAQGFDLATPTRWLANRLNEFCSVAEFGLGLVPHGAMLLPPSRSFYDVGAFQKPEEKDTKDTEDARFAELRARLNRLYEL